MEVIETWVVISWKNAHGKAIYTKRSAQKRREKQCFRPKHQAHKPGGANSTGHIHQLRDFNGRKQEQVGVGHTIRTQSIQRAEDAGGISGYLL